MNSRLQAQLDVVDQVIELAKKNKVDAIIFLGDLFDSDGEYVSKIVYDMAAKVVRNLAATAPLYLITGNHDIYRKVNLLSHFLDYPDVTVVTQQIELECEGFWITMVGWGFDFNINPEHTPNILCGHFGINGCQLNQWQTFTGPLMPRQFAAFAKVFTGHIHKKQIMGPNIIYVGAVMQHEMGDLGDEKGITLMLDQQLKFVKTKAPQFRRVEIYTEKDLKDYTMDRGEDYYEIVLKSDTVEYIPTSYKEKVVEDFEYATETRLETVQGEELMDTVERFIDKANTAIDKKQAKDFLRDLAKGVK